MKLHFKKLKYASDKTLKEKLEIWFVKDHNKAIKFRIFNLILKLTSCLFYIIEVLLDPLPNKISNYQYKKYEYLLNYK